MLIYSVIRISDFSDSKLEYLGNKISAHFKSDSDKQRKESVSGRILLTHMLKEYFSLTDFYVEYSETGKPYLSVENLYFNISHCDDYVLCVCGSDNVGCDIETVKPYNENVARRFFTENEYKALSESKESDVDFIRMWTLKESALKFSGDGLSGGLDFWDFSRFYKEESFSLDSLRFNCRRYGSNIISFCSTCDEIVEVKTDINKIQ